jgi:hypothetical protein
MKGKNRIYNNATVFFLLILTIILITGCGSGSGTLPVNSTANNPTPVIIPVATVTPDTSPSVPQQEVISTLTEISTNSSTVSSSQGGEVTHEGVKIQAPPNALLNDSGIKISTVSIHDKSGKLYSSGDNNHGPIYKISSGNPNEGILLTKPVKMEMQIDPSYSDPGLAIWTGEEWIALDKKYITYDNNTNLMTLQLTNIPKDTNEFVLSGDFLESIIVVTSYPNANFYPGDPSFELVYNYPSNYESAHFTIHYTTNVTDDYVQDLANSFEACYNLYTAQIGYNTPVSFAFYAGDGNLYVANDRRMVYIKYPGAPKETTGGWASSSGIIALPVVSATIAKSIVYHELFHFVQFSYNSTPSWFKENTADLLGYYSYNQINTTASPKKYDCSYEQAGGYGHWDGADTFRYSLDKYVSGQFYQYYNWVPWAYTQHYYGVNGVKAILSNFAGSGGTLSSLDSVYTSTTGKSLREVYFNAFEDFYIYGQVYNKTYFNKLSARDPNEPLCATNSGYSSAYNYEAFNSGNNPYYNGSTVAVEHLSGECFNFRANGNQGGLSLTVTPANTTDFKVKYFVFKNNSGVFDFLTSGEYVNSSVNNVVIPYSDGATDITILLENSSLTVDNNVNLKASGTSVISQGNAAISVVQPIPSEAAKIKIDIKTLSGDPVKSDEIILPATSKTISSIPSGQQYQFIVYAVDGSDNILAHRIAYKSVIENSTIAVNARLGVSIVNGKFIPNSPVIDHNSTFYWGNSDSTTYTVNFTFNGTPVSLTVPALNISNPSPSYVNYSFPLQAPAGNMAVALKNGAIVIDNGNLTVRKGNFSITVD